MPSKDCTSIQTLIALPHVPQKGGVYAKLEVCIHLRRIHPRTACDTVKIFIHLLPECPNEEPKQKETFIQECYTYTDMAENS